MKSYVSLRDVQADLGNGIIDLPGLVSSYLEKIEARKNLNAFLEVWGEESLRRANEIQQKIVAGKHGKLAGMVLAIKDNICFKDHRVSASSKILGGFESLFSSTVVERLLAEDAIIIGRTNCDEFAMGSSTENSAFGPTLNPLNEQKVPGGSSGGSAAAVAGGLCLAALGSDTGGSIRQPASLTGLIGFKPTYGRVSRHGLIAYASSFDQIGTFSHSVWDTALITEVMSGADDYDSTLSHKPVPTYSSNLKHDKPARIALLADTVSRPGLNPEVKSRVEEIVTELKSKGHVVEPVSFPYLDYVVPAYYVLTTAEASSNLARFDGIHYGFRSEKAAGIDETYRKSRTEGFGTEVKRRIMLGTFVLSAGYYVAYYGHAQQVRRIIRKRTLEILSEYDFILLPSTTNSAFDLGANVKDPITMYLEDIFTVQANLSGTPAISLPLGRKKDGMPFGIQLVGKVFGEEELLAFSEYMLGEFRVGGS
jgi:aspartyl-tRNA(Asn)/glutamyl-tRNA(Gln) amidotransferase subunit A